MQNSQKRSTFIKICKKIILHFFSSSFILFCLFYLSATVIAYGSTTPAGILIGMGLYHFLTGKAICDLLLHSFIPNQYIVSFLCKGKIGIFVTGILTAIAAGTFIYVSVVDILVEEFSGVKAEDPASLRWGKITLALVGLLANGCFIILFDKPH